MRKIDAFRPPPWEPTMRGLTAHRFRIAAIRLAVVAAVSVVASPELFGQDPSHAGTVDITQATLEDLMNIEVTSVSKKSKHFRRQARRSL